MKTGRRLLAIGMFLWVAAAHGFGADLRVSTSWRHLTEPVLRVGEPLRVAVRVSLPRQTRETSTFKGGAGGWTDAVVVSLHDQTGKERARAEVEGRATGDALISSTISAGATWRFAPEVTQALGAGEWTLHVSLAGSQNGAGKEQVQSAPRGVRLLPTETTDRPEWVCNRAHDLAKRGQVERAVAELDRWLRTDPMNGDIWRTRATVCGLAGYPRWAVVCDTVAVLVEKKTPRSPAEESARARWEKDLRSDQASMNAPRWVAPPAAVLLELRRRGALPID